MCVCLWQRRKRTSRNRGLPHANGGQALRGGLLVTPAPSGEGARFCAKGGRGSGEVRRRGPARGKGGRQFLVEFEVPGPGSREGGQVVPFSVKPPGPSVPARSSPASSARRQQFGEEAIGFAHRIKTDALARLGELIAAMPKATGSKGRQKRGASRGSLEEPRDDAPPTLADLGISKKVSAVAQQALPHGR